MPAKLLFFGFFWRLVQAVAAFIFWTRSVPQSWFSNLDQVCCVLAAALDFPSMETSIWSGCVLPTCSLGQVVKSSVCAGRCSHLTHPTNSLNSWLLQRFIAQRLPAPSSLQPSEPKRRLGKPRIQMAKQEKWTKYCKTGGILVLASPWLLRWYPLTAS